MRSTHAKTAAHSASNGAMFRFNSMADTSEMPLMDVLLIRGIDVGRAMPKDVGGYHVFKACRQKSNQ